MDDKQITNVKSSLFDDDGLDKAAEYLRLALTKLAQHKSAVTPVNYSLAYNYVSGKDEKVKFKLDEEISMNSPLSAEKAKLMYMQLFYNEDEVSDSLRADLLTTVAQVIGSLIDISGKTKISNGRLDGHINSLAKASGASDILKVVTNIVEDTRNFVLESRRLESDLQASVGNITKLKVELVNARKEAAIDSLTSLNNRGSFDNEMEKMTICHAVNGVGFCIILVDIDNFKLINDEHGHLVGDKVLKSFAQILKNKVRESDFTGRFGGEEFAILLPNTSVDNACSVAENIRKTIEKNSLTIKRSGIKLGTITASFGVASHRKNESIDSLLERCDKAMYRAKHLGRNKTVIAE